MLAVLALEKIVLKETLVVLSRTLFKTLTKAKKYKCSNNKLYHTNQKSALRLDVKIFTTILLEKTM